MMVPTVTAHSPTTMHHYHFALRIVNPYSSYLPCIPYPTFAQFLAGLDDRQPHFGWSQKFTQPLTWVLGGRPLDAVAISALSAILPETLCVVFDLCPVWVSDFCTEVLLTMEHA